MMIDIGPKFFRTIPTPGHDPQAKVTDLKILGKLNYIWYDRCWSKILFSIIPTPGHGPQVKVTDLEI